MLTCGFLRPVIMLLLFLPQTPMTDDGSGKAGEGKPPVGRGGIATVTGRTRQTRNHRSLDVSRQPTAAFLQENSPH